MTGETLKENNKAARNGLHRAVNRGIICAMNSLQVVTRRQQRQSAAWTGTCLREFSTVLLVSLVASAAALLIPLLGGGATVSGILGGAHAGTVLAFSLVLGIAVYSVLSHIQRVFASIRASIKDAYEKAAAPFFALAADYITLSVTASACAFSSRACAAQSHTRTRMPDAGRILSSVRDLFARTVAHLRAVTSTLRAAGSGSFRAV